MSLSPMMRRTYQRLRLDVPHYWLSEMRLRLRRSTVVNASGVVLHVNPADSRAVHLSRRRGVLDRNVVDAWKNLVSEVNPTVIIDVGANYGEVGLAVNPGPDSRIHLIEANPDVANRLRRTVGALGPKWPPTQVHEVAATDTRGELVLYIDRASSGLSSVIARSGRPVVVRAARLEELIPVSLEDRVLFKIDVEGHEVAVLDGMGDLSARATGICEIAHLDDRARLLLSARFQVEQLSEKDAILRPRVG